MTLIIHNSSFQEMQSLKKELAYQEVETLFVCDLIDQWLSTFNGNTKRCYMFGIKALIDLRLLLPHLSLAEFSLTSHEKVIDKIKNVERWSEKTKQSRAAIYISFTSFLERRYPGICRKAIPQKHGSGRTFFKVHEKVVTQAMTETQMLAFFKELEKISSRACLIGKITLQGGKRINEVLTLRTDQICWEKSEITFVQSKTHGMIKETVITYPETIMKALRQYIGNREGVVFITMNNKSIHYSYIRESFKNAGTRAKIPFRVTPHVLRATAVTLLRTRGFSDSDIQKVTGHASVDMVNAYDKSDRAQNASKKVNLIT